MSNVSKEYLVIHGIQRVPSGPTYQKVTKWFKVSKGYLCFKGIHRVPSDPRYSQGT